MIRTMLPLIAALCLSAHACLWDYETLAMETTRWPGLKELIAGKFPQHTKAYYQWIVADREKILADAPENLDAMNDIGVALDKLGRQDDALAWMDKKDAIQPGLYETEANRGTFLIHAGKFEEGLVHIKKAIEINPDAHFGREIVQHRLVEYVLTKREAKVKGLPLHPTKAGDAPPMFNPKSGNFASFLFDGKRPTQAQLDRGILGVSGMVRFGYADHPILLEALGDILSAQQHNGYLAARAYLRAAEASEDQSTRKAYTEKAEGAMSIKMKGSKQGKKLFQETVAEYRVERKDADAFQKKHAAREQAWIDKGLRVDEEFVKWLHEQ